MVPNNNIIEPGLWTWILLVFGAITLMPLLLAQTLMLIRPRHRSTRSLLIGEGENWRDDTHFRSARGMAWADWLILFPLFIFGCLGVMIGSPWGYLLWGTTAGITLYINVVLWFMEKTYVYPSRGPLVYYTYYWGFFVVWGTAALVHSVLQLLKFAGITA